MIVSSDGINDSMRPWLIAADVHPDNPGDILAIAVAEGWVNTANLSRVYRPWLTEQVGSLDSNAQEHLDTVLRAGLDL